MPIATLIHTCDNVYVQRMLTLLWFQAVQVEMTGGEYGMLRFELGTPKVDPIKAHSGDR